MIRPYLRDLINYHKPTPKLNNANNNANNNDSKCREWKIQLVMQNNCISVKNFEDTRTIYSASKPVEIFMGSDIKDVIDRLFDTTLERFQQAIKTSIKGSEFTHEIVASMYYYFQKIDMIRAESYIKSDEQLLNKGASINPKNEKDKKCFQHSITSGLNYDKIKKYIFSAYRKIKTG